MTTKKFRKKIKPFFLDKGLKTNNIILKGKDELTHLFPMHPISTT